MKNIISVIVFTLSTLSLFAQEKFEVEGGIKIGNTSLLQDGIIRFTGSDFQGRVGGAWKSLMSPANAGTPLWTSGSNNIAYRMNYVGIGTTSPQRQLHIKGNGGLLNLEGTDHTYIQFYPDGFSSGRKAFLGFSNASTSNFTITNQETNGNLEFKTQDGTSYSTKMTIKADGNIGISNSNPNHKLDFGNTLGKKLALYQNPTRTAFYGFGISNNTLEFHAESTSNENPQMVLKNTGLVGIGTTNPAVKLNIVGGSDVHVNGGYLQLGASNGINMGLDDNEIQAKTNGAVSTLHLQNTGGDLNLTQGGGNVGIGILAPTQKLDVSGNIRSSGELISTASTGNQLRLVYGNYGIIHRNDGGNYWILSTASGGQYGTYNSHRPFKLNMASGDMTLNNGSVFFDHSSKRVGIGTTSPGSALQVNGETRLRGTNHQSHFNYSSKEDTYIRGGKTTSNLYLNDTGNKVVVGHSSTPTPGSYKFYVDGGIMAEEVKVALSNTSDWADDAFDRVPTLDEMEQSIQTNSHLYGMPSAQELKDKGVNLLEMDALQMEKIEWLYMYVIDQEKRIKELEAEVKKLKQDD